MIRVPDETLFLNSLADARLLTMKQSGAYYNGVGFCLTPDLKLD